jgi:asparagine synthase (glutamine-hydrolysing)
VVLSYSLRAIEEIVCNTMCGIFGSIRFGGMFPSEEFNRFVRLTDMVAYRGPDDAGYIGLNTTDGSSFQDENQLRPFDVFLGHRRLSIIDLSSAGRQPMTDGHGRWIIFNGEIFNFIELREELKSLGCIFRTETDTEVILHLYGQFGEAGFKKMNGMWAFALADLPARRIILSRDRFSIKPLYLFSSSTEIYFASEIKQLVPLLRSKKPNLATVATFLAQGLLDHSSETFFEEITKAPAKCNLVITIPERKIETIPYWNYTRQFPPMLASACEEFRELLLDSTRIRLRSDVGVGLLLSGGLDSSSIAVSVARTGHANFETFSVVSNEPQFSEEPFIDAVNNSLGLKGMKHAFQLSNLQERLLEAIYHSDEPFVSLSVVAQYCIFQIIKTTSDARVLLSGQGADEIMLGYLKFFFFYVSELYRKGDYLRAFTQLILSAFHRTAVSQFRLSEAKRYMPSMNSGTRSALRGEYIPVRVWEGNGLRSRQIADLDAYSVPALTHYEDRNSMAHSLEVRHPFLDHRIVDFALSLPPEWQLSHGWTKNIMRASLSELPDAVRWRRDKRGFITAEEAWLKNDLSHLIESTFTNSVLDEFGILDSKIFRKQYRSFRNGSPTLGFTDISRTFVAELWAQQQWR